MKATARSISMSLSFDGMTGQRVRTLANGSIEVMCQYKYQATKALRHIEERLRVYAPTWRVRVIDDHTLRVEPAKDAP